jgi:hypothetical protein
MGFAELVFEQELEPHYDNALVGHVGGVLKEK